MNLRAGQSLFSTVDATSLVVIKAPADELTVTVGGSDVADVKPDPVPSGTPEGEGTLLGKRYADEALGIEFLVSRPGTGTLEVNGAPLRLKESKPLPSSD